MITTASPLAKSSPAESASWWPKFRARKRSFTRSSRRAQLAHHLAAAIRAAVVDEDELAVALDFPADRVEAPVQLGEDLLLVLHREHERDRRHGLRVVSARRSQRAGGDRSAAADLQLPRMAGAVGRNDQARRPAQRPGGHREGRGGEATEQQCARSAARRPQDGATGRQREDWGAPADPLTVTQLPCTENGRSVGRALAAERLPGGAARRPAAG